MVKKKAAPIAKTASKQKLSEEFDPAPDAIAEKADSTSDAIAEKENASPNKPTFTPRSTLSIPKKRNISGSKRAGLTFPVARTLGKLRNGKLVAKHIQKGEKLFMKNKMANFYVFAF